MTSILKLPIVFALVIGGLSILVSAEAQAYCIINKSSTTIHVQGLDAPALEADIKAGAKQCCTDKSCMNAQGSGSQILAVSGYVPVKGSSKPGWKAECRAKVSAKGTLVVSGSLKKLKCQAK